MNYYETLYIVHPALESGRLKDIILSLQESLNKLGGKTLSIDLWGKKRLAYLIDKQKYGTYVKLQFTGEGNCNSSFAMELGHNPNILSYLTTLIEESDVIEQGNDLDTQIAGQSRESQRIDSLTKNSDEKHRPEDDKSSVNDETPSVEAETTESAEEPVDKADETDGKDNPVSIDAVDDAIDKSEAKETDASVENVGETTKVSEEE